MANIEIKYDTPIEVTEKQYKRLMNECSGIVAGRQEGGRFYIKVWAMRYVNYVRRIIK